MQLIIIMFSENALGLVSADSPEAVLPNAGSPGWGM